MNFAFAVIADRWVTSSFCQVTVKADKTRDVQCRSQYPKKILYFTLLTLSILARYRALVYFTELLLVGILLAFSVGGQSS